MHPTARIESSGRRALLAGLTAALVAGSFGWLHRMVVLDWPTAALDGPGLLLAYLVAGTAFQVTVPVLCLVAFSFGASARRLWTTRIGLACAGVALAGYALYVRACLDAML